MIITITGEKFIVTQLNLFALQVEFPNGKIKVLSKDSDHNWVFDINDWDLMLADILGRHWLDSFVK